MPTVAITDYTFDNLDTEKGILGPLGCTVVSQKSGKDIPQLIALVRGADSIVNGVA